MSLILLLRKAKESKCQDELESTSMLKYSTALMTKSHLRAFPLNTFRISKKAIKRRNHLLDENFSSDTYVICLNYGDNHEKLIILM